MNNDGNSYFAESTLQFAREQAEDSRKKLIYMSPADFLSVAMNGHNPEKEATVNAIFKRGLQFEEVPFLNFVHDGEGTAMVTGHEGRHRALFLQSQGVTEMPVLFQHRYDPNGQPMVWEAIKKDPTVFQDEWPRKLYGERGGSPATDMHKNNHIAFPVPDLRLADNLEAEARANEDLGTNSTKPRNTIRPK